MNENDYMVIEFVSGRKIAVKPGEILFMNSNPEWTEFDGTMLRVNIGNGHTIVNISAVALIRRPEEHEIEWCKSFHF